MRNGSLLTFLICLICFNAQSQQILSVGSKSISYNSYAELDINLQNSSKISAIQFDINASLTNIIFPSVSDSIVNTNRFDGHSISYSKISETQIRIIIFSLSNKNLIGVSGKLLGLKVKSNTIPGANNLVLSNITIADSTGQSLASSAQNGIITVTAPQINVTDTVRLGNIPMLANTSNYLYFNNNGNDTLKISSISSSNSELTFNGLSLPITLQQYQGYNLNYIINPLVKGNKVYPIKIISNDPSGDKYVYIKDSAYAVNKIYFTSAVTGSYNTEADVSISIKNQENYSAFQLSITLPDGIDYVANSVALDNSRKQDHVISANIVNGVLTIIAYSASLKNFQLNDGQVFTFKLKLNKPGGTYTLPISNASITNVQAQNIISDYVAGTVTIKSPSISLNNSSLYFGRISTKEYAQTGLSINNNGTENLIINKITYPSTSINSSISLPLTITPGANQWVNFGFHSSLPVDLSTSLVTIQSNDPLGDKTVSVYASTYSKNELYLKTPYLHHSASIRIPVMLTNYDSLKGAQFDIQINSPTKVSFNDSLFVLSDRFKKFSASYQKLDDQNLRVILFSLDGSAMLPDSAYMGELLLNIVTNQPDGNYGYVDFANVVLGGTSGQNLFSGKAGQNIYLCNGSINLNLTGTVNFCDQITLQANLGNASVWYKNDTLISNYTASSYLVTSSGSYKSVIANGACNYISNIVQTVKSSAPPIPVISNSKPLTFCTGDSTVLTSSSSNNNQWLLNGNVLTGDTLRAKTVKTSGIYTVQINNGGGCASTSLKDTVVMNALPATPIISNSRPLSFCVGDSTLLTSSLVNGNQWYLNDTIINNAIAASIIVKSSGRYSVINTNSSGCTAISLNTIVTANALPTIPTISNSRPLTFTSGDSTRLNASSAYAYQWFVNGLQMSGSTDSSILVKSAGTYTVRATNSSVCSSISAAVVVVVNAPPSVPLITNTRPLNFCVGDSTILSSSYASGNQWYLNGNAINNANKQNLTVFSSGSYTVTSSGSASSVAVVVTVNSLPSQPSITNNRPLVFCLGDSTILSSTSLIGNQWYLNGIAINGATLNSYKAQGSGNYTVTVKNDFGCTSTSNSTSILVNSLPAKPTINNNRPLTFLVGDSTVLTSSSSIGNQWYFNGFILNGATAQTLTAKNAGNYSVVVTNISGCSTNSDIVNIVVNAAPIIPVISNSRPLSFCEGDSTIISSSLNSGNQWFLNGVVIPGAVFKNLTVKQTGSYSVTSGGSANSVAVSVLVNSLPANPSITNNRPLTFCSADSTVLSSSSNSNNQWSLNGTAISGATAQTLVVKSTGNYLVQTSNSSGCTSQSSNISVTVNPVPSVPIIANNRPLSFCVGDSSVLSSSALSGNQWYMNGILVTGANQVTYTAKASGIYTVQNVNGFGCTATSTGTTITSNALPSVPVITNTGSLTFNSGDSTKLSSSSSTGNQWYLNGFQMTGANAQDLIVKSGGSYLVTVVNASGCSASSTSVTVTVNAVSSTPVIINLRPLTFCVGDSTVLSSSSSSGNQWSLNGTAITGATSQSLVVKTSGNYSVVSGGSASSVAITVIANVNPSVPVISNSKPLIFCVGDSTILSSSIANGNQWYQNGLKINGALNNQLHVDSTGLYSIQNTNEFGCKSNSLNISVLVNNLPTKPVISTNGALTFCQGQSITLTSSSSTSNQWYLNGTIISGAVQQNYTVSNSGDYTVENSNASGCSIRSSKTTVLVNSLPSTPVINNSRPLSFYAGDSTILTSSILNGNQWLLNGLPISGAYLQSLIVKTGGDYSVKVTNASGCSTNSISVIVTVSASNSAPFISNSRPLSFCNGDSTILTSSIDNGNQWYLNGVIISNQTAKNLVIKIGGSYSVMNSGQQSTFITVIVNALPSVPTISNSRPLTFIVGDSTILNSSTSYLYQWILNNVPISGASLQNLIVKDAGTYRIRVSNISGCTAISDSVKVTVNTAAMPVISNNRPLTFCNGDSTVLSSSYNTANQWLLNGSVISGATAKTIVVKNSGNYSVTVNINGNNISSATVTVVANPIPAKPTIVRDINNNLVSSANAGNQWYTDTTAAVVGQSSKYFKPSTTGYYSVQVNQSGCLSPFSDIYYYILTAIINYGTSNQIDIYPNPAKDRIVIKHNFSALEKVNLELLDMNGRVLYKQSYLKNIEQISIANLGNGLYYIHLYDAKGKSLGSTKILKL